jgi:hypothetical protein
MIRRLLVLLGFVFLSSISARAQNSWEVFAGYSYEALARLPQAIPAKNLSGIEVAVQYKFKDWLGVVGEVDGHWAVSGSASRALNVLGGAQFSYPRRISPYGHVLVGYGHGYTNGIWDNSLSVAIGGGVDMQLARLLSWRIIEGDDVITRYFGAVEHNPRISTGLVLRF